jgi:hypothetical protein
MTYHRKLARSLAVVWGDLSKPQQQALVFLSIEPRDRRTKWQGRPSPGSATLTALERRGLAKLQRWTSADGRSSGQVWKLTERGARLLKEGSDTTAHPPALVPPNLADVCRCGHELGQHTGGTRGRCAHRYNADLTCACLGFVARPPMRHLTVSISGEAFEALAMLGRSWAVTGEGETIDDAAAVDRALVHLAASAADGVRRPGAWERGWIEQAFGELRTAPHRDGLPYHEEPARPPAGAPR